MTDLDKLIEAVDRGVARAIDFDPCFKGGIDSPYYYARAAYHGSLDAAKALHDALLPGWVVDYFNITGEVGVTAGRPNDVYHGDGGYNNPARAWLIAILKAYRAQQEIAE